jgi:hypothetical protein
MRALGATVAIVAAIVVVIIGIPVAWLGSAVLYQVWNSYSHSFRLTLEVDTPDGVKAGASVIRVTTSEHASWVPVAGGVEHSVQGEAVFVDLGHGRNVIATLGFGPTGSEDRIANLAVVAIEHDGRMPSVEGRADLSESLIPTLVTFSDLDDPTCD